MRPLRLLAAIFLGGLGIGTGLLAIAVSKGTSDSTETTGKQVTGSSFSMKGFKPSSDLYISGQADPDDELCANTNRRLLSSHAVVGRGPDKVLVRVSTDQFGDEPLSEVAGVSFASRLDPGMLRVNVEVRGGALDPSIPATILRRSAMAIPGDPRSLKVSWPKGFEEVVAGEFFFNGGRSILTNERGDQRVTLFWNQTNPISDAFGGDGDIFRESWVIGADEYNLFQPERGAANGFAVQVKEGFVVALQLFGPAADNRSAESLLAEQLLVTQKALCPVSQRERDEIPDQRLWADGWAVNLWVSSGVVDRMDFVSETEELPFWNVGRADGLVFSGVSRKIATDTALRRWMVVEPGVATVSLDGETVPVLRRQKEEFGVVIASLTTREFSRLELLDQSGTLISESALEFDQGISNSIESRVRGSQPLGAFTTFYEGTLFLDTIVVEEGFLRKYEAGARPLQPPELDSTTQVSVTCAVIWFRQLQEAGDGETSEEAGSLCIRPDSITGNFLELKWVFSDYVESEGLLVVVGPKVKSIGVTGAGSQTRNVPVLRRTAGAGVAFLDGPIAQVKVVALDASGKSVGERFFLRAGDEIPTSR